MEEKRERYDAFISYRHLPVDKKAAVLLQQLLENLTVEEGQEKGKKPKKRKLRVFRDQTELPTSGDLGADIRDALKNTRYLITVCSREFPESRWCMEEVRSFLKMHDGNRDRILVLLVDGSPEESIPLELTGKEYTDVRAGSASGVVRKLRREYLRLGAAVSGCEWGVLYGRKQAALRRRWICGTAAAAALLTGTGLYSREMIEQIRREQERMLEQESLRLASEARQSMAAGEYDLAMLLALEALPKNWEETERPVVEEAKAALRSAAAGKRLEEEAYVSGEATSFRQIGEDGNRVLEMETSQQEDSLAQIRIYDGKNLESPLFEARIRADSVGGRFWYFVTENLEKVFFEAQDNSLQLWEAGGELLFCVQAPGEVTCLAAEKEGKKAAVAFTDGEGNSRVRILSAEDGSTIGQLEPGQWIDGEILHMEFDAERLLVSGGTQSALFDLTAAGTGEPAVFPGGNQGANRPRYLTGDGLLFCTLQTHTPYCLTEVYDVKSGEAVFGKGIARTWAYDEETGTLAYQSMNTVNSAASLSIAFRRTGGRFETVRDIRPRGVDMMLRPDGFSLDEGYVLLCGPGSWYPWCELYSVETGKAALSVNRQNCCLVGDRVLGMERRGTQLECFPVLEGKELIDAAKTLLTEEGEQRTLTQEEKKEHFIR